MNAITQITAPIVALDGPLPLVAPTGAAIVAIKAIGALVFIAALRRCSCDGRTLVYCQAPGSATLDTHAPLYAHGEGDPELIFVDSHGHSWIESQLTTEEGA